MTRIRVLTVAIIENAVENDESDEIQMQKGRGSDNLDYMLLLIHSEMSERRLHVILGGLVQS